MKTSLSPAASVVPTAEDLFFGTTGMALRAAGIQLLSAMSGNQTKQWGEEHNDRMKFGWGNMYPLVN